MDLRELSQSVSLVLRHEPWRYELELDAEGWVNVEDLLGGLRRERAEWATLSVTDLRMMIDSLEKVRHEIRGEKIRALYGHSVPGRFSRSPAIPQEDLFHGTSPSAESRIRQFGIVPMGRQFVHLSTTEEVAREVGRRKSSSPVVLSIDAVSASRRGIRFYLAHERVWLADLIPPEFIRKRIR